MGVYIKACEPLAERPKNWSGRWTYVRGSGVTDENSRVMQVHHDPKSENQLPTGVTDENSRVMQVR